MSWFLDFIMSFPLPDFSSTTAIIAQILGFFGMGLGVASFQAKRRVSIILLQSAGSVLWSIHFALLGATTGLALNVVAILRGLLYACKDRFSFLRSPLVPILTSGAFIAVGTITAESLWGILPIVAMCLASVALFVSNERVIRILSLFSSPLWLIYDAVSLSLAGVLTETFNLCSIIIALFRFRQKKAAPQPQEQE